MCTFNVLTRLLTFPATLLIAEVQASAGLLEEQ